MSLFKSSYLEFGYPFVSNGEVRHNLCADTFLDFELACIRMGTFLSTNEQSLSMIEDTVKVLESNLPQESRIILLFSGGKDSTLLAKLLKSNKNEVTLAYFHSSKNIDKVVAISERLEMPLIIIERFASTDQLRHLFRNSQKSRLICGGTNVLGLASLSEHLNVRDFDVVIHGQGSDSLSSAVHNQRYNLGKGPLTNVVEIAAIIFSHFILMTRKKKWINFIPYYLKWSNRLARIILDSSPSYLYPAQIQILIAYFITFIPIDGYSFKQFESIWKVPVYSPFHVESTFRHFFNFPQWNYMFTSKPLIDYALEELAMSRLFFLQRGFNLQHNSFSGKAKQAVYALRGELYSSFLNEND